MRKPAPTWTASYLLHERADHTRGISPPREANEQIMREQQRPVKDRSGWLRVRVPERS
jgi:hypothetical protein